MYRITFDGNTIYDPRVEKAVIAEPNVHLAVSEAGMVSFRIYPTNPNIERLTKLKGILELTEDGTVIYRGRIIRDAEAFDLSHTIETEGLFACLNDSIIPPYEFPEDFLDDEEYQEAATSGNVVEYFLAWILNQHNDQVTSDQKVYLGNVTVSDANNYITRASSDYSTSMSNIKQKLIESNLGGYIVIRYENDGTYIDYVDNLPLTNEQTVEFGKNLLDIGNDGNATEAYSVILPIGTDGLTINDLPDGPIDADLVKSGNVIYSNSKLEAYGRITHCIKWDDVTVAENLKNKASETLAASGISQTITAKACDLHVIGEQSFRVGRLTRIYSSLHGFSALYPLVALDIDIFNPGGTEISFNQSLITNTEINKRRNMDAAEKADRQQLQLDRQDRSIAELSENTTEQITSAIQNSQSIILSAVETDYTKKNQFEEYKNTVATNFEVSAGKIEAIFERQQEAINGLNGEMQTRFENQKKYIRFEDGKIILGMDGNKITLAIQNDRVSFFQSGKEVAWFANNKLYVTEAEFTEKARIGDFAFTPGLGGNLSFKKVGI